MGQNYEKILILTKLFLLKVIKVDKIISFIGRNGIKYAKTIRCKSIIVKLHTSPKAYAQLNQHNL